MAPPTKRSREEESFEISKRPCRREVELSPKRKQGTRTRYPPRNIHRRPREGATGSFSKVQRRFADSLTPYQPPKGNPLNASSPENSSWNSENDKNSLERSCARLHAIQKQWLINAKDDLTDRTIDTIPAIPFSFASTGAHKDITDMKLIPSDVWLLRSLSPTRRYIAYTHMTKLARKMTRYDQNNDEYQTAWNNMASFRAALFQREQAWVASSKEGTNEEIVARLKKTLQDQAVEELVTEAMVQKLHEFEKCMPWYITNDYLEFTNESSSDEKKPAEKVLKLAPRIIDEAQKNEYERIYHENKPEIETFCKGQMRKRTRCWVKAVFWEENREPEPEVSRVPEKMRPDRIRHPLDKVPVPEYPLDSIYDYTPHPETDRYKCRHPYDTGKSCCRDGLTREKMASSISKGVTTWKAKVERLIDEGKLHASHKTWDNINDPRKRCTQQQKEAAAKRKAEEEEHEEEMPRKKAKFGEDQTKRVASKAKSPGKPNQKRGYNTLTSHHNTSNKNTQTTKSHGRSFQRAHDEHAAQEAHNKKIEAALKTYDRQYADCYRMEIMKKWPDWDRFNEWWNVKRSEVQGSLLSAEQRDIIAKPEPSGIPDRNPNFAKNIQNRQGDISQPEQTTAVEKGSKGETPNQDDDLDYLFEEQEEEGDGLDDLFEDDEWL